MLSTHEMRELVLGAVGWPGARLYLVQRVRPVGAKARIRGFFTLGLNPTLRSAVWLLVADDETAKMVWFDIGARAIGEILPVSEWSWWQVAQSGRIVLSGRTFAGFREVGP